MKLKNDKQRINFLCNYRSWGLWVEVEELKTKYYKCELPDGSKIVACEFVALDWGCKEFEDVKFSIIKSKGSKHRHYNPITISIPKLIKYLRKIKEDIKI